MAAATQSLSPASRQPFGVLGDARLRAVESVKNQQNGQSPSLKRRYDDSNLSDSENVDPMLSASITKRQKNQLEQDSGKQPTNNLRVVTKPQSLETPVKGADNSKFSPPKSLSTPKSAPLRAPAGRSPKSKVSKPFSRRSIGSNVRSKPSPFTKPSAPRAPFSIADALNGTFNVSQSKRTKLGPVSGVHQKKSWNFEIHVDTEQEEMANLMEHSTCTLDISDDEGKSGSKDDRGKENIPPNDLVTGPINAQRSVNASNVDMADGSRGPLEELDPKNFIPEGVNASDAVVVPEDEQDADAATNVKKNSLLSITEAAPADGPPAPEEEEEAKPEQPQLLSEASIRELITGSAPPAKDDDTLRSEEQDEPSTSAATEFDIWESGSAAEERVEAGC